jgi:hypothetical protein
MLIAKMRRCHRSLFFLVHFEEFLGAFRLVALDTHLLLLAEPAV